MREKSHIRSAFISVLIPLAYALIFLLSGAVGLSLEESEGAYTVFIGLAAFLLVLGPLVLLICGIVGNVHGGLALRDREHKGKSIVLLAVSGVYTVSSVVCGVLLWIGLMQELI